MHPLRAGCRTLRQVRQGSPLRLCLNHADATSPSRFFSTSSRHLSNGKKDVTINYFEEEIRGTDRKRRRVDPEEIAEQEDASQRLRDENLSMEAILHEVSQDTEELDRAHKNVFTQDEIRKMQEFDPSKARLLPHQVAPTTIIPQQSQVCLTRLNECLDMADFHKGDLQRTTDLWLWYLRCKLHVPGFLRMVPKAAWDLLWTSQGDESPSNPDRPQRLLQLTEDKLSVDWKLTPYEKHVRIEGLFLNGKRDSALAAYEDLLQTDDRPSAPFLEMGIRMHAMNGEPQKALDIANQLFALVPLTSPRLLLSVIKSFAQQRDEASLLRAYELYQDMRQRLANDFNMSDFDLVSLEFLAAGRADFALAIFRDMMILGESSHNYRGSEALSRLSNFIGLGTAQDSTTFSLEAIKHLPRRFQNKFFYASWLKKLIGEGEVQAAGQVVELMYERGVRPDARHINGIIAAMTRMNDKRMRERAEKIGWSMIQHRLNFVQRRKHGVLDTETSPRATPKSVTDNGEGLEISVQTDRPVPMATIETFSILLQNYARRQQFAYVRHLRDLLVDAEIPMDSFFMNHILYAELRSRGYQHAFARFEVLRKTVRPDLETFLCLWQCSKHLIYDIRKEQWRDFSGFTNHRQLFAQMMQWMDDLEGPSLNAALADMTPDIYHHILRAFCIAQDLKGAFVALYALKQRFGCIPSAETFRELVMMFSRLRPINPTKLSKTRHRFMRRQRVGRRDAEAQEREMKIAGVVLDKVQKRRMEAYEAEGLEWERVNPEMQAEETFRVSLEMVWTVLRQLEGAEETQAARILEAAQNMGVEKFDPQTAMQLLIHD